MIPIERLILASLAAACWLGPPCAVGTESTVTDASADAVARPSDPGGVLPFDPEAHRLIDLLEITVGAFAPVDPSIDPFAGDFDSDGEFLRLDLIIAGLVNPPGSADPLAFLPFIHGDHPVYGFIEIDMDSNVWTGGELNAPQYRYLGNVARFGGLPTDEKFRDRTALDDSAFDGDIASAPFVDRHGEEFHLALLGTVVERGEIVELEGNGDSVFDEGESWHLRGPFLHRAHGFEPFSLAIGGRYPGEYSPKSDLLFRHDTAKNVTHLSLVSPLTPEGAGLLANEPPELMDEDPSNQACVLEALTDLQSSAYFATIFPTGLPEEDIIMGWEEQIPSEYLDPAEWDITVLLGTSYTQGDPSGLYFVWTDIYPDVILGDVDGSGGREDEDYAAIETFIAARDGFDGIFDEVVTIPGFALNFSVFDLDYNGQVDEIDERIIEADGDTDSDDDVDLADLGVFQRCFAPDETASGECLFLDLDGDRVVGPEDFALFVESFAGPEDED